MPDPKFTKPWHGVPREQIDWHPAVNEEVCIGCGTCVTGCSRLVYRFDYERRKAVVVDPLNCMVGCTTCANTCPTNAITFPPLQIVLDLEGRVGVHHSIEDELVARRPELAAADALPHPDRLVELEVSALVDVTPTTRLVTLVPRRPDDCMCEFTPGQYVEIQVPGTAWLARAYSIANAPRGDGSIELQVRRVEHGRLSGWVFETARVGDVLQARGPVGTFTMRSPADRPLVFVAGGTGFAPIKGLIEQQLASFPDRRIRREAPESSRRSRTRAGARALPGPAATGPVVTASLSNVGGRRPAAARSMAVTRRPRRHLTAPQRQVAGLLRWLAQDPLGHLGAGRVVNAEEQDPLLHFAFGSAYT